jgi:hypothetical protein
MIKPNVYIIKHAEWNALYIIPIEYTTCLSVQTHNMIILNLNQALINPGLYS